MGGPHKSPKVQGTWKLLAGDWEAEGGIFTSHNGQGLVAGVQPRWIQGIRSEDRVSEERLIYKERLGKNSVVGKLVEKRGLITWFTQETNKATR